MVLISNLLIGAMAGFNMVSAYDLLINEDKQDMPSETSDIIGTISLLLLVLQGVVTFITKFIIPCIKNTKPVNTVAREVNKSMQNKNSEVNASIIYIVFYGILFGLNLYYEKDYGDNCFGLVAGTGSALALSIGFHLIVITFFDAVLDDTNYITRPIGLRTKIRNYLWDYNGGKGENFTVTYDEEKASEQGLLL